MYIFKYVILFLQRILFPFPFRLRIENYLRERARNENLKKRRLAKLQERFPQIKAPAS